jgi:hypothetical protein
MSPDNTASSRWMVPHRSTVSEACFAYPSHRVMRGVGRSDSSGIWKPSLFGMYLQPRLMIAFHRPLQGTVANQIPPSTPWGATKQPKRGRAEVLQVCKQTNVLRFFPSRPASTSSLCWIWLVQMFPHKLPQTPDELLDSERAW